MRRIVLSLAVLFVLVLPHVAFADNVDTLVKQLGDSSSKIRLAAAVNLAKSEDERGILPLAKSVTSDSDKNVRAAAAVGLGKLLTANPSSKYKTLAMKNLANAAANDSSDFVKQQADAALKLAQGKGSSGTSSGTGGSTTTSSGKGGIYVNVGPMSSKTGKTNDAKWRAMMVKVTEKTLGKTAPTMALTWPGGVPTKSALTTKGASGFYVDGTLNTLDIKTSGTGATISCKVSMLLADFPDKSVFGFLNGGASVTASNSAKDQELAAEDCVTAVIENLIANKIIPTIKSKVP